MLCSLALVKARISYTHPSPIELQDRDLETLCDLANDDCLAVELLLGAFLWRNVLAQASTRVRLPFQFDPELLLENGNIHLEHLFGCDNWVVLAMARISKLSHWERECEQSQKLSVAELVR